MRMPLPAVLLALVLGLLSSLAVACGDTSELLTERRAARLTGDVDRVADAVQQGDCEATAVRLQELQAEVADLPSSVSSELRRNLSDGVTQLTAQAEEECQGEQTETQETTTEPAPEVETTPTETTETTEPPPAETETQTQTETEPPTQTTPPDDTAPPAGTTPAEPTPAPDAGEGDGGTDGETQGDAGTGGVDGGTS